MQIPDLTTHTASSTEAEPLVRSLGLWGLWLLVVNGLVGAGIFGLAGGAARLAGDYSLWVFLGCALLMLPILLCFAELASYFNGTGGPVRYVGTAFGRAAGFQAGWLYYLARVVSVAANSVLLVDSIGYFWPLARDPLWRTLILAAVCASFTCINVTGALQSIRTLGWLTLAKFGVLLLLIGAGVWHFWQVQPLNLPSVVTPNDAILQLDLGAAMLLMVYAFVGFESAVVPAGEAKNPQRDIPKALLLGLGMVTVLYMLVQWVSMVTVPDIAKSTTPLLDVAAVLGGTVGAAILMFGVICSVGANLLGAMFSTPRVSYALAREGSLPAWFGRVHPKFLTPANAIIFFGALAFLLAAFGSFIYLASATVLIRALLYGLCCGAIPKLRPRLRSSSSFILPGAYLIPILGLLACGWLVWQVKLDAVLLTGALLAVGLVLYIAARRRQL
ncbi:cationic amino acid transporter [Rheinheimera sp. SA_1]|uniref:APC family permease n=1 Tax=Rheinheimera sp. SA_1 TaxID=1827365 RepID=UPI0007FCC614|nr:APC family permease [Rheinheimera sp. SA_1]OBP16062.1 cationic amino acid transporter [Rheinheimera sp. SA_1]